MLGTHIIERHDLTCGQIIEPTPDRGERALIGKDLRGLLQGFVLVDRDQYRRRSAVPSDRDVLTTVSDLVEQIGEVGTELPDGHGLGHAAECISTCTHPAVSGLTDFPGSDVATRALPLPALPSGGSGWPERMQGCGHRLSAATHNPVDPVS